MSAWTSQPDSRGPEVVDAVELGGRQAVLRHQRAGERLGVSGAEVLGLGVGDTRGAGQRPGLAPVGLRTAVLRRSGGALLALVQLVLAEALGGRRSRQGGGRVSDWRVVGQHTGGDGETGRYDGNPGEHQGATDATDDACGERDCGRASVLGGVLLRQGRTLRVDGMDVSCARHASEVGRGARGGRATTISQDPDGCKLYDAGLCVTSPTLRACPRSSVTRATWSCARASRSPARRSATARTG